MKRLSILLFLVLLGTGMCFAQEAEAAIPDTENSAIPEEEITVPEDVSQDTSQDTSQDESQDSYIEDEEFIYKMNQKGDQFIKVGLMVNIPLHPAATQLKVGGAGTLGYMRFLNSNLALGGDASFSYMTTVGKNVFTCIPLMAKVMYQFTAHKFEFPVTLGIGGAFQNYIGESYFGLIIKPEVGAFFRYSPDWSFGVNVGWNMMPQWTKDSSYFGVIMDIGATVRYHF